MNSQLKPSLTLILVIAAVCLAAWPSALAAETPDRIGSRIAQPGLEFRFDQDVFPAPAAQTGVVAPQGFSRLSIRLYGGYSHILAADVNDGSDGFFELFEAYAAQGSGTLTGGYKPLHGGFDFGADLIYQITPNIGVGLGAGFMRNSSRSLATWTLNTTEYTITAEPALSAIPIRLGAFFTFPLAGQDQPDRGYRRGLLHRAQVRRHAKAGNQPDRLVGDVGRQPDVGFLPLGFHGSLGLEYMVSPKMGLFVEAAGRYAKLKNFAEVTGISNSSGGSSSTTDGKLYIETQIDPNYPFSMFTVEETPPVDDADTTYREPKFDLSGFSLRAGIRIRF